MHQFPDTGLRVRSGDEPGHAGNPVPRRVRHLQLLRPHQERHGVGRLLRAPVRQRTDQRAAGLATLPRAHGVSVVL